MNQLKFTEWCLKKKKAIEFTKYLTFDDPIHGKMGHYNQSDYFKYPLETNFEDGVLIPEILMLTQNEEDFLQDYELSKPFILQIQGWSFKQIFLSSVLDFIAKQLVSQNFTLSWFSWEKLVTFGFHPEYGEDVINLFTHIYISYGRKISKKQTIINGTSAAFSSWGDMDFNERFPIKNKKNVIKILEFLEIPKRNITFLVEKSFEIKNFKPILSFLETYQWPSQDEQKISSLIVPRRGTMAALNY